MSEIITSSIEISAGIVSSGLTVDAGGDVTVLSGGTVTDAEAVNYGYFWVEEGGYIGRIRVTNSGDAMVNGGLAENLTMESGGMADVFSGVMRTGTILNGGYGAIYETGSGLDVAVSAGGRYLVNGGYAENTVVSGGGSFTVQLGSGLADKTTVEADGHARIVSGGQMWETILNGGRVDVISGTILATTINGGELHVSSGSPESDLASGYVENTILNSGSLLVSGASAKDTTVNGGSFIVSGGAAQKTTVKGGSFIATDATVQSTTVSGGSFVASDATVQSTTVSGGAVRFIGGTADKTDLFSGTVLVSGGTVQNTTLGRSTGGSIVIPVIGPTFTPVGPNNPIILNPINWDDIILTSVGGTATITYGTGGSILLDGGATVYTPEQRETIGYAGYPGQTVNGDEASAGEEEPACRLDILNGGLAVSTTVNSGLMRIFEGGAANETTVYGGGSMLVSGGGIAHTVTMRSNGGGSFIFFGDAGDNLATGAGDITITPAGGSGAPVMTVFEGGLAVSATVSAGLLTLDGGTASNTIITGGTMHILNGGAAFVTSLGNGFILADNGTLNSTTVTGGTLSILNGGTLHGATVTGGTVRIMDGGTLSGTFTVTANADFHMESGSVIAFDITNMTPGAEAESSGLYYILGAPSFTLTVSDTQATGVYALCAEAAGFRDTITVQNQFGEILGTLTVGNTTFLNNRYYKLRVTDNVLNLTVTDEAPARMWAPAIVFVNPEWSSLPDGSTVEPVAGLSATVGTDAFATGRDATNAVAGDGTVVVAGGEASFQYGITRDTAAWTGATVTGSTVLRNGALTLFAGSTGNDLTVTREGKLFINAGAAGNTLNVTAGGSLAVSGVARGIRIQKDGTLTVKAGGVCSDMDISASGTLIVEAGGYLTGTGKFASGSSITVNGTINFDLTGISAGNSALFSCNNVNINGAPNFTITVSDSQENGIYTLADRISDLDGLFTILNVRGEVLGTLSAGGGILINGRACLLRRGATWFTLTITSPEETNVLYVNTEWAPLEPDAVVEVPSGAAVIGVDAFGDLHTAEEHLTEDRFIVITGGTYASETISVGITMDRGTITGSVITETGSLTLNGWNDNRASNLTVDGALVMYSSAKAADLTVSGRLTMNDSSEAENVTVTGSLVLNGSAKAKNLTAGEGAVVRGADRAKFEGAITIGSGATLTGTAEIGANSELVIDGKWVFDIAGMTAGNGKLFRTSGGTVSFSGTAKLVITVSDTQETGLYSLASGITGFENAVFTVVNTTGATVASLAVGESVKIGDMNYRLSYDADTAKLNLAVSNENQLRVYVDSSWQYRFFGDVVSTPDGTAIYGVNAFSDLNAAQDAVSEYGTVYVVGGKFDSGSITRNVQVSDTTISGVTVSGYGTLTLNSGVKATDITVSAGSLLTVNSGATLTVTSPGSLDPDAFITVNGELRLDLTQSKPGDQAFVDASLLPYGSPVKVDIRVPDYSGLANGIYTLVSDLADFTGVELCIRKQNGVMDRQITLALNQELIWSSVSYMVTWSEEDPTLRLLARRYVSNVTVNPDWAGLENGTVVDTADIGRTATVGYDAFATLEEAEFVNADTMPGSIRIVAENGYSPVYGIRRRNVYLAGRLENTTVTETGALALLSDATAKNLVVDGKLTISSSARDVHTENVVVNGTFSYQQQEEYTTQDITINEGGKMTGWAVFEEDNGFVINGTLDFKLACFSESWFKSSTTQNGFLYRNLYNVQGNAGYSITINFDTAKDNNQFKLASGVSGFQGVAFSLNYNDTYFGEITVGSTKTLSNQALGNRVYTLEIEQDETTGEDCLVFTITQTDELVLSSEWEGVEDGTVVHVSDNMGGKDYTIGETAFYDADTVMEKAYGINAIRILSGSYSFTNGITAPIRVWKREYVDIHDTEIASTLMFDQMVDQATATGRNLTVLQGGLLSAYENVRLDSITVRSGGRLSMDGDIPNTPFLDIDSRKVVLTGRCVFEEGARITLSLTVLDFDISGTTAGAPARYEGFSCIQGTNVFYTLTVSGTQEYGDYLLATGVTEFADSISISVDGVQAGSVSTADKTILNGTAYTLKLQDGSLILSVAEYAPPSVVYLNSDWQKAPMDTVVEIPGGTAVIGYDAFADAAKALAAAGSVATVAITGGTFAFASGIDSDISVVNGAVRDSVVRKSLTVEAGGKLTGWNIFAEGANITVNGTLDFDISAKMGSTTYLYSGLSFVQGSTNFTLTVRDFQSLGQYALADGVTEFNSTITVVNSAGTRLGRLSLGTTTIIGDKAYRLTLNDGILSVALLTPEKNRKCDVDGNGVSDVLFQYTGGDDQTGYWLNGRDEWRSSNAPHPVEWTLLGAYDMDGDGLADSVFVGNTVVDGRKGAYIGYYKGGIDTDENWVNISFLENEAENVWVNRIGNLTGNAGANSIVWHCAGLGAIGVWTDSTNNWVSLGVGFDSNWTLVGCGDFNGDGRDSIVMSYANGAKYYAIGIDGSAVDMGSLNWAGWEVRAIGDFKGDGKDDMILFHKEYGAVVMIADGKLDSYTSIGQLAADDWFIVGCGDYDGDRKDDLLVRQYSTGMLGYYSAGDTSKWTELGRGVDMDWTVIA